MAPHILDIQAPTVEPTGAPRDDFEHIPTSPEMFGGFGAQAKEKIGTGLVQGADATINYLDETNRLQNQVHASQIHSWFSDQASGLVSEFSQLEGKTALDRLPEYKSRLQDLQKQAQSQSGSPQETSLIAVNTRNTMDRFQNWMVGHADKQRDRWFTETAKNNITSATGVGGMAILNTDMSTLDLQMRRIDQEAHNYFDPRGLDPEALGVEVAKERGRAVKNWVETAATNDKDPDNIGHAMSIFERYTKQIDPDTRLTLSKYLNKAAEARAAGKIADVYIGGAAAGIGQRYIDAFHFFRERGYSDAQAAGIAGGLRGETENLSPTQIHDAGIGLGISGWNKERLNALRQFARQTGGSPTDTLTQLEFVDNELRTTESAAGARLHAAQTPEQAGQAMLTYFRPSNYNVPGAHPERAQYARQIFNAAQQGGGAPERNQIDAEALVNEIYNDPLFKDRPELQSAVIKNIMAKASVLNRADALKNKQFKEQSDASELGFFKRIHGDDPKLTLDEIFQNSQDSGGPLSREATTRLTKEFEDRSGDTKTVRGYGPAFGDFYDRTHLPDGDPNKITTATQLYPHRATGELSVSGIDKLISEMSSRKTPEGDAEATMRKEFIEVARARIAPTNAMGIKLPRANEDMLKFYGWFFPEYERLRAGEPGKPGKSAADLLTNPNSPDYMGKAIDTFAGPLAKKYLETIEHEQQMDFGAAPAKPGAPFDINSVKTLNDAMAAFKDAKISRDQAAGLVRAHPEWGVTMPTPAAVARQIPMSR